jgi:hypothetical protein
MTIGNAKKKMFSFQQFVNRLGRFYKGKKRNHLENRPTILFLHNNKIHHLVHTLKRCFDI